MKKKYIKQIPKMRIKKKQNKTTTEQYYTIVCRK